MYQKTARAAVWSGAMGDEPRAVVTGSSDRSTPDRTIWAKVPLQTRHGRCLAVRQKDGKLWVAIAGSPHVSWLPADGVLTEKEAAVWAATGF